MKKLVAVSLLLVLLIIAGCSKSQANAKSSNTSTEFVFEPQNCKDYLVSTVEGELIRLSELINKDYKSIVKADAIPGDANQNIAVFERDTQIGNRGGILKGYIVFLDEDNEPTVNDFAIKIEVRQINDIDNEINKTLLYETFFNITKDDFKLVTYNDGDKEVSTIAYHTDNIRLKDFDIKPDQCIGELNITATGKDGKALSSTPLILFTDYDKGYDNKLFNSTVKNASRELVLIGEHSRVGNQTENPLLWRIEGKKPSYLFGTIHRSDRRVLTLPAVVVEAINNSDVIYNEIELNTISVIKSLQLYIIENNQTLQDLLPEELFERVDKFLLSKGVSILQFSKLKVWALSQVLLDLDRSKESTGYDLDRHIYELGLLFGKKLGGLESPSEQLAAYNSLAVSEQTILLNDTLNYLERGKVNSYIEELFVNLYIFGDEVLLKNAGTNLIGGNQTLNKNILDKLDAGRNIRISNRISANIKSNPDKSYFYAIGAFHYPGENGVIKLLENKGFKVTRVSFDKNEECKQPFIKKGGRCYLPYGGTDIFVNKVKYGVCEEIARNYTREYCYIAKALEAGDASYCYMAGERRSQCALGVAVRTKDYMQCPHVNAPERDFCYYNTALVTDNPSLCDNIEFSVDTSNTCYLYFASKNNNTDYCEKIKFDKSVMYPYSDYEGYYSGELITYYSPRTYKDVCIKSLDKVSDKFVEIETNQNYYLNLLLFGSNSDANLWYD